MARCDCTEAHFECPLQYCHRRYFLFLLLGVIVAFASAIAPLTVDAGRFYETPLARWSNAFHYYATNGGEVHYLDHVEKMRVPWMGKLTLCVVPALTLGVLAISHWCCCGACSHSHATPHHPTLHGIPTMHCRYLFLLFVPIVMLNMLIAILSNTFAEVMAHRARVTLQQKLAIVVKAEEVALFFTRCGCRQWFRKKVVPGWYPKYVHLLQPRGIGKTLGVDESNEKRVDLASALARHRCVISTTVPLLHFHFVRILLTI